jgi:hypothetical protein
MYLYNFINLTSISSNQGNLNHINKLPFDVKRIFTLDNLPMGAIRGNHAHHKLLEILIPIQGSFDIKLSTPCETTIVNMDVPLRGIILYPYIWRTLYNFTKHSICLSLCSLELDENDYIRNWDDYVKNYAE